MAEEGVHAYFYKEKVLHGFQSQQEGRPVYIDQDFVHIRVAGMDKDIIKRKATQQDKERFAEEWAKYERGHQQTTIGTPLEQWPRMTPALVATLKGLNILTVEDMATLSDLGCQKVGMGAYDLRTAAQKYLNAASQTAAAMTAERLEEENAKLRADIASMQEEMADLRKIVEAASKRKSKAAA